MANAELNPAAQQALAEAQLDLHVEALKNELTKAGGSDSMTVEAGPIGSESVDISRIEYIPLYNTLDGRKQYVLPSMLRGKLGLFWRENQQVDPRLVGKPVWSSEVLEQEEGEELVCYLHPESPMRERATELGIANVCPRAHIKNSWTLRQHMTIKHKKIWAAFEDAEEKKLRAEARDDQRSYMETLQVSLLQGKEVDVNMIAAIVAAVKAADVAEVAPVAEEEDENGTPS